MPLGYRLGRSIAPDRTIGMATPRSCRSPAPRERSATLAIGRECPSETRGITEAGQTLTAGRGPEIRQQQGPAEFGRLFADPSQLRRRARFVWA
jgi:hypothetical protein